MQSNYYQSILEQKTTVQEEDASDDAFDLEDPSENKNKDDATNEDKIPAEEDDEEEDEIEEEGADPGENNGMYMFCRLFFSFGLYKCNLIFITLCVVQKKAKKKKTNQTQMTMVLK